MNIPYQSEHLVFSYKISLSAQEHFFLSKALPASHMSNEKIPGCLRYIYIGKYTTQLCGDYNKPL